MQRAQRGMILALVLSSLLLAEEPAKENAPAKDPVDATFERQRRRMVEDQLRARGIKDERVLAAMQAVPRHELVRKADRADAYDDHPLPIGHGQTISQPYIVGLMTELLQVAPGDRVLEVGTGSGYQAAILAAMSAEVYSIEIYRELHERARERLTALGYEKVRLRHGDGALGWPEHAPFDAAIVTCAASHVPPALIEQLKPEGRMCIPVGPPFGYQRLLLLEKNKDGKVQTRTITGVQFVPLIAPKDAGDQAPSEEERKDAPESDGSKPEER